MVKVKNFNKIILLFSLLFVFSLILEFSFSFLYNLKTSSIVSHSGSFAIIDIIFLILIFFLISLASWNLEWFSKPQTVDYLLILVLGIFSGQMIEKVLVGNFLFYNNSMPIIFGASVISFVKYSIIFLLSLFITNKILK